MSRGVMPDKVTGWCNFGVSLQHTNWRAAIDSMAACHPNQAQVRSDVRILKKQNLGRMLGLGRMRGSMCPVGKENLADDWNRIV